MDAITQSLTALAGQLVANGKEETAQLSSFKEDLFSALENQDWLVNKRETPFLSTQTVKSLPAWAAGRQIAKTLGPFRDQLGRLYWFDFYRIDRQIKIIRKGAALPFLSIPVHDTIFHNRISSPLDLKKGSVWCISNLITSAAPAACFTGLTVNAGHIAFSGTVTLSGDTITIGATDSCRLDLELAQPATVNDSSSNTGNDAKKMDIQLPEKLVMDCLPGTIVLHTPGPMNLAVYGTRYQYARNGKPPHYDTVLNRIFIPFDNKSTQVQIKSCDSPFVDLGRSAPITENAWALPVTQSASIDQLGDAAGIGGIAMITGAGLTIKWSGLENSPIRFGHTYILTEPGRIALTVLIAFSGHNKQSFDLWQMPQHPDIPVYSKASIQYSKQFAILYNALSISVEALLLAEVGATLSVDRPNTADGRRPSITTDKAELLLFRLKNIAYCYLQATRILDRLIQLGKTEGLYPVSFALSNALIKTTPIDDFYLLGIVEHDRSITKGALKLVAHVYNLLPSLPDPYVSSFSLPNATDYNRRELYARSSISGIDLYALTGWLDPATPKTILGFEKTAAITGAAGTTAAPAAAATTSIASVRAATTASAPAASTPNAGAAEVADASEALSAIYAPATANLATSAIAAPSATTSPTSTQTTLYSKAVAINPIAQTRKEDEANALGLVNFFQKQFGANLEGNIVLLDVSTNADLMGVGLGLQANRDRIQHPLPANLPFTINGIDLATFAINTKVYTLPQIQWEPVRTIQNPDVAPYPFPSPATSAHNGIPTVMAVENYELVPIAPKPVVDKFISAYNAKTDPGRIAGLFDLPFGMMAAALWDNANDPTQPGASIDLNQPEFDTLQTKGAMQISVIATSPNAGDDFETPGYKGATIQLRNLIELLTGNIPVDDEGKPLSVLGPVVDTIFNGEFNPNTGALPRVPVERMDVSGYGATMFSNWLNPNAVIAATSQAKFDVWIGRTSHEVIQVKSILYPWGVPVVRTITIQRTSGGGVTRHDSGWKAQGPGRYDFSYYYMTGNIKHHAANPFDFHPGSIREINHITSIKDTGRIYRQLSGSPNNDVIMQEVLFNADVLIDDVQTGAANGYVPSRGQRGFVQLAPYQKPLTPEQFYDFMQKEGPLGGPVDCVVNVGQSGQTMRIRKVDVTGVRSGAVYAFVSTGHGSAFLPKEGSWSVVRRNTDTADIVTIDPDAGLPLIREGKLGTITTKPYRFADPQDILQASDPDADYGILHSTGTQRVLYLRPTITESDNHIKSELQPYLADSFAIVRSKGIFPDLHSTFPIGAASGASLQVLSAGKLKLVSGGHYTAPPNTTRDMVQSGTSRIYIDYKDAAGGGAPASFDYSFDSNAPIPWTTTSKNHSLVVDLAGFTSLVTVTTEFDAKYGQKATMPKPTSKFGSVMQPIVDMLSFLGGEDLSNALAVSMSNLNTTSWQPKLQAIMGVEIEFQTFATAPPKFEVKIDHAGLDGEPPIPIETPEPEPLPVLSLGCDIDLKAYFNMNPHSLTATHPDGTPATPEELAEATNDMLSTGAELEIEGELHVLVYTITPNVAGVYFVGILGFEFGIDDREGKKFGFKVAMGVEVKAQWPVVGEVSVMMAVGLEMEWSDSGSGVFALIIFKGEAELLGGLICIGIGIEAKGGQETEVNPSGVTETYAVVEVEFAVEVSLAFVIHFEFDETWQEKRQTA